MDFKDYYKTIGVSSTATISEIKGAYRKLSKKFHPDVNNGDKFFEERFKEIQEAYEVLTDDTRRKTYDYKYNKSHDGREYYKQAYDEFVRKKEEEFDRRNNNYKHRDEELNRKEKEFESKAKKGSSRKRIAYTLLFLGLSLITVISLYLFSKQNLISQVFEYTEDSNANTNTSHTSSEPIAVVRMGDYQEISKSYFINFLDGKWRGKATQFNINEIWDLTFECDLKKMEFKVTYPSLGCSGFWTFIRVTDESIDFNEQISSGRGKCTDNGLVRLIMIDKNKLEYYYYLPNSTIIGSKGIITKS